MSGGAPLEARKSPYADVFKELQPEHDPRHIEAYVRLEYGTLGNLAPSTMRREAQIAADCILVGGAANAESLAQSFGL